MTWRGAMVVAHAHSLTHSLSSLTRSLIRGWPLIASSSRSPSSSSSSSLLFDGALHLILFGLFEGGVVALEVTHHIFMMCLVSTATNLEKLGITPQLLNVVLSHISVTAKDLNGTICHILSHLCAKQLYTVRIKAVAV
mmetsp:Transcript_22094/g.50951  ORF Transcript_22094/g.50951 Transcript_22094/m.50951 type:complete len:138 (+) Transcript_22094:155-568(+)